MPAIPPPTSMHYALALCKLSIKTVTVVQFISSLYFHTLPVLAESAFCCALFMLRREKRFSTTHIGIRGAVTSGLWEHITLISIVTWCAKHDTGFVKTSCCCLSVAANARVFHLLAASTDEAPETDVPRALCRVKKWEVRDCRQTRDNRQTQSPFDCGEKRGRMRKCLFFRKKEQIWRCRVLLQLDCHSCAVIWTLSSLDGPRRDQVLCRSL